MLIGWLLIFLTELERDAEVDVVLVVGDSDRIRFDDDQITIFIVLFFPILNLQGYL